MYKTVYASYKININRILRRSIRSIFTHATHQSSIINHQISDIRYKFIYQRRRDIFKDYCTLFPPNPFQWHSQTMKWTSMRYLQLRRLPSLKTKTATQARESLRIYLLTWTILCLGVFYPLFPLFLFNCLLSQNKEDLRLIKFPLWMV